MTPSMNDRMTTIPESIRQHVNTQYIRLTLRYILALGLIIGLFLFADWQTQQQIEQVPKKPLPPPLKKAIGELLIANP